MKVPISNILTNGKAALHMVFIMCSLMMLLPQEANATHIVGGNLTYRCLGNNLYEIRLSLRRDCLLGAPDAQFDDPASIGFYDLTTNQLLTFVGFGGQLRMPYNSDDTLNQILISDCTIAGNEVCVHQTTYIDTIFLPFWQNGYVMSYQRCCRNSSVNNILDPLNTGMTLVAELTAEAQNVCKSSPQIGDYPPIYICVNKPINYFPNATDINGDSLGYRLETPYAGGDIIMNRPQPPPNPPYDLVNWRPPYSLANVMGGIPLAINPITGEVTGTPNTIGQFVISIVVTSYRNGVKLAETRVDFQYNVRMCRDKPVADYSAPDLTCDNLTVNFINESVDADDYLWIFDYGNPDSDTSTAVNPTYTFDQEGFYDVALIVSDSEMICMDTIMKQIGVFTTIVNAEFSYGSTSCTDGIVLDVTDLSTTSDPQYPIVSWEWLLTYSGGILASTEQHPSFSFDIDEEATVFLVLTVTDTNGCKDSVSKSFQVKEFDINFNPEANHICKGEFVHLLIGGDSTLTYVWSPPNGLDTNKPWDPIAFPGISVTYYVTVTDDVCTLTDSIFVEVQQAPNMSFTYSTDCRDLEVEFNNTSTPGITYHWDFGDPAVTNDTSILNNPTYTYGQPGVYIVTLTSKDGCDFMIKDTITVNAILEEIDSATVNCFENSIGLNPGGDDSYDYIWSPAQFLDDSTLANPTATVEDDTWFYVTITDPSLPGCELIDSILLLIPDVFDIAVSGDVTSCDFHDITLTAVVTGNMNVEVIWKDPDGVTIGTGLEIVVSPTITTTYVVMAMDTLGCIRSDEVTVFKPDPTFVVDGGNDSTYCYIQTITLCATSVAGVTFEWFNANGDLIGTDDCVEVTPGTSACFYVVGTDILGCQAADTVCLTPVFYSFNAGPDQDICLGESATLSVVAQTGVTFEWFDMDAQSIGSGLSVVVSPSEPTCYYVTGTDALGCQDTDTVCVDPIAFDASIVGPDVICLGDEATLTVVDNNNQDLTYLWSPGGSTSETIIVMPTVTTTYSVIVTNGALGCKDTLAHTVEVSIFNPAIVITSVPDSLFLGESGQLFVNQDPGFEYVWSASTGELVDPVFNPIVTPLESTTYCVTVTDFGGCTGVACYVMPVSDPFCDERDIFLPNAFTPNGDGENDILYVRSNFVQSMELHIYNRWGEKVFTSLDISVGWDGTFNGKELSPDVFGYYLNVTCPNQATYFKKGNITLLH